MLVVLCSVLAVVAGTTFAWTAGDSSPPEEVAEPPPAAPQSSLFATATPDDPQPSRDRRSVELGLRFLVTRSVPLLGVRIYRFEGDDKDHVATLWDSTGRALGSTLLLRGNASGWQFSAFSAPVSLTKGAAYVVSYHASAGYAAQSDYFKAPLANGLLRTAAPGTAAGVFAYTPTPLMPTKSYRGTNYWIDPVVEGSDGEPAPRFLSTGAVPSASSADNTTVPKGFPGPSNTGVPDGVRLAAYAGPNRITRPGTVIDGRRINGTIEIAAPNVTIKRSKISGNVFLDDDDASVTITDSDLDGGQWSPPTIGYRNLTVRRSDVRGGQHSIRCDSNCLVEDSWLHDQYLPADEAYHNNAYLSNGGSHVILRGNTFHCTPRSNAVQGGCTADVSLFADFGPIKDVLVTGNLFRSTPGGYCGSFGSSSGKPFGDKTTGVVIKNNVFERGRSRTCGRYGVASAVGEEPGTSWSGNRWLDGGTVR